jgi:hypothetical protein
MVRRARRKLSSPKPLAFRLEIPLLEERESSEFTRRNYLLDAEYFIRLF